MIDKDLYADTIATLVAHLGDEQRAAEIIGVRVEDLRDWTRGKSRPPVEVFLRIVNMKTDAEREG